MLRKILIVISSLLIALYLFASRPQWFSELERQINIGNDYITSEALDLSKPNTFQWIIPREKWHYEDGKAYLDIIFDRKDDIPINSYDKEIFSLRVKVAAYGVLENNEKVNRLIKNWYYLSDEPFAPTSKMSESYSTKTIKYSLAGIDIYPFEKTVIEVEVLAPDEQLAKANPRLKIVGEHDYAVSGHIAAFRLIRDGGFLVSLIALLFLTINSVKVKKPQ